LFEYRGPRTSVEMMAWIDRLIDLKISKVPLPNNIFKEFTSALIIRDNAGNSKEAYRDLFDQVAIFIADEEWEKKHWKWEPSLGCFTKWSKFPD